MHTIILGDTQAIFRAGTARVLAREDDFRIIAQCSDLEHLHRSMEAYQAAVLLVASTLKPDFVYLLDRAKHRNARVVVLAESSESTEDYASIGVDGIVYRNISGRALVECMRGVLHGERWIQTATRTIETLEQDLVGQRVCDRLTPKELKIVASVVEGCRNKEIAMRLGTTEQVIKNYLRGIFDKTGVSDRLELALFTVHHRRLAEAAAMSVASMPVLQAV